ncbi:MAG: hypothetical protein ABIG84_02385 [archaeon]
MSFMLKLLAGKPGFSATYKDIEASFKDKYARIVPMWQDEGPDKFIRMHLDETTKQKYVDFDAESGRYTLNQKGKRILVKETEDLPLYFTALSPEEAMGVFKFINACRIQAPREKAYYFDRSLISYKTLIDAIEKCLVGEPINIDDITKMNCGILKGDTRAVDLGGVLTYLEESGILTSDLNNADEDVLDKFIKERYG